MSSMPTIVHSRTKKISFVVNLIIHILYALSLPIWYLLSLFSVMLFDSPGSEQLWQVLLFYYALQSYPYTVLVAIILSWIMYKKGLYRWTYVLTAVPALIMIMATGLMIIFGE